MLETFKAIKTVPQIDLANNKQFLDGEIMQVPC